MPGVGKSTLAKLFSKKIEFSFIDLDTEIERDLGLSINKIFEQKGEEFFRRKEREILLKAYNSKPCVIALGGGTPAFFDNIEVIKNHSISIYIDAPISAITNRLIESSNNRPLFANKSSTELESLLLTLYQDRKKFYEMADLIFNVGHTPPKKNLPKLLEAWADFKNV